MRTIRRHVVTVVTDGSGVATAYSPILSGKLKQISYIKAGASNYADGVDFTITSEATGQTLWTEADVNATKHCMPRAPTHSTAGVAATYDGTRATNDEICLSRDRVKIVLAQGGDTKTGAFHIVVED